MGLLNDVKSAGQVEKKTEVEVEATTNDKRAKAKARKAEKAAAIKKIVEYLKANPIAELQKEVDLLSKAPVREGGFAPAFTPNDLFGENAKAGAKISAVDVFVKFKKGYPEMKKYIKKWAEKGIKVSLDAATQSYILG